MKTAFELAQLAATKLGNYQAVAEPTCKEIAHLYPTGNRQTFPSYMLLNATPMGGDVVIYVNRPYVTINGVRAHRQMEEREIFPVVNVSKEFIRTGNEEIIGDKIYRVITDGLEPATRRLFCRDLGWVAEYEANHK